MASDEVRKKWGTIFMGEREASVEQLNAMHERLNRDKIQKEETENYMDRVRARAADRAREILGEAYAERQKVLEEAKEEAAVAKRMAAQDCVKIKAEGEELRKQAQAELEAAQAERAQAEQLRANAHDEGYQAGMNQAGVELHEFRADLGQSLASLMRAIERERRQILENWREELADLTRAAVQAGTGYMLQEEHDAILRQLVYQALDHLESRNVITFRVNPRDEEVVGDLFRAARERAPELKQWIVHGDESIEPGGLVADSGSGSVDMRRANFREMVDGILDFMALPERDEDDSSHVASLVEREVAHIASLTPELDRPETAPEPERPSESEQASETVAPEVEARETPAEAEPAAVEEAQPPLEAPDLDELAKPEPRQESMPAPLPEDSAGEESLAELEDELFPLDEEMENSLEQSAQAVPDPQGANAAPVREESENAVKEAAPAAEIDAKTLNEGGFL